MFPSAVQIESDMEPTPAEREHACLLALVEAASGSSPSWTEILLQTGSAAAVLGRTAPPSGEALTGAAEALAARVRLDAVSEWVDVLRGTLARSPRTRFIGLTDEDFPVDLREVPQRPPYLFVRGSLRYADSSAVAVVGSRHCSPAGLTTATEVAAALANAGHTVVSGLAAGIDTAAHLAAIEAGGRTIASLGAGIDRPYPAENAELAARIGKVGCLVSRFWPDAPPRQTNFPLRNVVTSGLAMATVVVEAGPTSGARMQARLALEQRRSVILLAPLLKTQAWARRYAEHKRAFVASDSQEVLAAIREVEAARPDQRQLRLF